MNELKIEHREGSGFWVVYRDGTEARIPIEGMKESEMKKMEDFLNYVWWAGKEN